MGPAVVPLDLLCALFPPFVDLSRQLLQHLFLVGIQLLPVDADFLNDPHQFFRRAGGVGSDVG